MGTFVKLIVVIGALWLVDATVFGGRYSEHIWRDTNYKGQRVQIEIRDFFRSIFR